MPAEKLSAKDAAKALGTDARTLRKFIRSDSCDFEPVGQGSRYEFTKGDLGKLKKQFLAWGGGKSTETTTKGKKTEPKKEPKQLRKATGKAEVPEIEGVEEIELDDLDDPTIEDLEEAVEDGDFTAEEEDEPDLDDDGEVVTLEDLDDD